MKAQKLNELAAKAMGWKLIGVGECEPSAPFYQDSEGGSTLGIDMWNPSTCADDALVLLEKMSEPDNGWELVNSFYGRFDCSIGDGEHPSNAKTPALAMTLCALRAASIPESEITAAMQEGA